MSNILKTMLLITALLAAWSFISKTKNISAKLTPDNEVVMYSITTCGYCKQKRRELTAAGIPFTEIFLDKDEIQHRKFGELLAAHNVPPGRVGTPSFVVNGELMVNNPPIEKITRSLKYKD